MRQRHRPSGRAVAVAVAVVVSVAGIAAVLTRGDGTDPRTTVRRGRSHPPGGPGRPGTGMFADDFSRPDGPLGAVSGSGKVWATAGTAPPRVSEGAMVLPEPGVGYASIRLDEAPVTVGGTVSMRARGSSEGEITFALVSSPTWPARAGDLLHCIFTRDSWWIQKRVGGPGRFTTLASGSLSPPLEADGTVYEYSWTIDGDTLRVHLPDGRTVTHTGPGLAGLHGRNVYWEIVEAGPDSPAGRWHGVYARGAGAGHTPAGPDAGQELRRGSASAGPPPATASLTDHIRRGRGWASAR